MIILMEDSDLNNKGANALQLKSNNLSITNFFSINHLENIKDTLVFIDLEADGQFQRLSSPDMLFKWLNDRGLSKEVNKIFFLISDIDPRCSLTTYATKLSNRLKKNYYNIQIIIPVDYTYGITWLVPPKLLQDNWQLFGLSTADYNRLYETDFFKVSYAILMDNANKKLLWQGKNILEWLSSDPDKIFTSHVEESSYTNKTIFNK